MEPDVLGRYHDGTGPTFRASAAVPAPGAGAPTAAGDALAFLRGTWRVERRLTDHAAGTTGSFTGIARWAAAADVADVVEAADATRSGPRGDNSNRPGDAGGPELTYRESGELRFGGHRGPASRSLIYRGRADGTADVRFADGRPFYHLDPRQGTWQARHDCGRDEYLLAGRRLDDTTIEERWRVRGPDKDYEITTTLVRA
jgi:Family of unknown function (DUF6314)